MLTLYIFCYFPIFSFCSLFTPEIWGFPPEPFRFLGSYLSPLWHLSQTYASPATQILYLTSPYQNIFIVWYILKVWLTLLSHWKKSYWDSLKALWDYLHKDTSAWGRPRACYAKRNKSNRGRQIPCDFAYSMWNLKK